MCVCLGGWFERNHDTCPECRFSITTDAEKDLLNEVQEEKEEEELPEERANGRPLDIGDWRPFSEFEEDEE